jgi:hypothetical protein
MNVLIGSAAIKKWFPDFPREPKDVDYIGEGKGIAGQVEFHKNPVFGCYSSDVLWPDDLVTLKASHLFWDINWEKHMFDTQFLLKKGCKIDMILFFQLFYHWETVHGKRHTSDLTLSAEEFFDNALKEYDHDYLHTLLNPVPTYTHVLKDGSEVEPDEAKFNAMSHEQKLDLVREEVYVMAFERNGGRDYRVAYAWMLKKFIMNHAPMWEALFIIENYVELHKPKFNYYKHLNNQLHGTEVNQ